MYLSLSLILLAYSQLAFSLDWQGHRGARGLYPENTIGSMEEALKFPVTTLELDVVLSKDNKIIVSHEPWMSGEICLDPKGKEIKGKKHNIFKMTYEEISKFDCGSKPLSRFPLQKKISTGKPTLEKLLEVTEEKLVKLNRKDVRYNIEIKSSVENEKSGHQPDIKSFSKVVVEFLLAKLPPERFSIQSFDWRVLKFIHKSYPEVRLVALEGDKFQPEKVLSELGFNPYVFSPYYKNLSKDQVVFFHKKNILVIPWTVNEVKDMESLIEMGVDGIITDYPNKILVIQKKKCKSGFNLFEGKCVDVPAHALPSEKNPGWVCKKGYVQKRSECIKIKVPAHGHLLPDGKTWTCDEGFTRYRGTCRASD